MKVFKIFGYVLATTFGIFMVIYGGYDDSPGGQLLGAMAFAGGIYGLIRMRRKK